MAFRGLPTKKFFVSQLLAYSRQYREQYGNASDSFQYTPTNPDLPVRAVELRTLLADLDRFVRALDIVTHALNKAFASKGIELLQ